MHVDVIENEELLILKVNLRLILKGLRLRVVLARFLVTYGNDSEEDNDRLDKGL